MTSPKNELEEAASRLVDEQEYMTIDAPDEELDEDEDDRS